MKEVVRVGAEVMKARIIVQGDGSVIGNVRSDQARNERRRSNREKLLSGTF